MTMIDQGPAVEEDIQSLTSFRVDHPKWLVEVFRLSDEAWDRFHVDVQTHDVFDADDVPAFADAITGALAHLQRIGGLRD